MATTFEFDKKTLAMLEQLKKTMGASSKVEVLRKAIALLKTAIDAQEKGGGIIIKESDDAGNSNAKQLIMM